MPRTRLPADIEGEPLIRAHSSTFINEYVGPTHWHDRDQLIKEVRKTLDGKKQVPPGKYAQIGYLSYLCGDGASARQYFEQEKAAYPESARFMDSLMARLR